MSSVGASEKWQCLVGRAVSLDAGGEGGEGLRRPAFLGQAVPSPRQGAEVRNSSGRLVSPKHLLRSHVLRRRWVTGTPSSSSPGGRRAHAIDAEGGGTERALEQKARAQGLCCCTHGCGQWRGDLKRGCGGHQCQRAGARVSP